MAAESSGDNGTRSHQSCRWRVSNKLGANAGSPLTALVDQEIVEKHQGSRCKDIVGDLVGTEEGKQICGGVIFQTHNKVNEILSGNNFWAMP